MESVAEELGSRELVAGRQQRLKLLFVVNEPGFFLSHRARLARAAEQFGFEVHVATPAVDEWQALIREGFCYHPIELSRWGMNGFSDIRAVISLVRLYRKIRPAIVHHVTIKPVLFGSLAARLAGVACVVNAVSGLGYIFLARGLIASLRRGLVRVLYRMAAAHPQAVFIVQNADDVRLFAQGGLVPRQRLRLIAGSGVPEELYPQSTVPDGRPLVLMPSRLLRDKGVCEFVQAARIVKERGCEARFVVAGALPRGNPSAISSGELEGWRQEGIVEFVGQQGDMGRWLRDCAVVCLPSYREGLPKALIEAACVGRAIVTTDVPGCREVVEHGKNGLLVPARSAESLAHAIIEIIQSPERLRQMGQESRRLFEAREFSEEFVFRKILGLYEGLLSQSRLRASA